MPKKFLDCQNLPCPQPVLQVKHLLELEEPDEFTILVDNDAAKENVLRFITANAYNASVESNGKNHRITAAKRPPATGAPAAGASLAGLVHGEDSVINSQPPKSSSKILVFIAANLLGQGDDALGAKLMKNFLATLPELGQDLWRVILVNGGVRLTVAESPVLDQLRHLEQSGVDVLVCGACLEHFKLLDKKVVGQTTNMLDIVTSMQVADKVIRP